MNKPRRYRNSVQSLNCVRTIATIAPHPRYPYLHHKARFWAQQDIPHMKATAPKTLTLTAGTPAPTKLATRLALAAGVLALLAIPHLAHAQGIVGGARDGSREGNRIAGPVGGVVGGAIGAGVGGAVGGVKGVFGIPDHGYRRGYRCRGYYDRYSRFHCYR
jgi:hypothetical protein